MRTVRVDVEIATDESVWRVAEGFTTGEWHWDSADIVSLKVVEVND